MKQVILVVADAAQGTPLVTSYEVLGLARRLADATAGKVAVAVLGKGAKETGQSLIAHGADEAYVVEDALVEEYQSDAWLPYVLDIVRQVSPTTILVPHTTTGADLAPRLAFRLESSVAMGCTAVEIGGEKLLMTRPCYGNLAREVVEVKTVPAIATIKSKTQESLEADTARSGTTHVVALDPASVVVRTRITDRQVNEQAGVQLESAKVIIAGGRGLGGADGFKVLEELAGLLGGAVGASRVACDLGWCPPSWQIGLTGKTVSPDLYVAVGISGASHHLAGIGGAKNIVAINNDPEAAMFKEATFGIVGDYRELIPALVAELRS